MAAITYTALGERAWALRQNVTIYDATYVALAELLDVPLVTTPGPPPGHSRALPYEGHVSNAAWGGSGTAKP